MHGVLVNILLAFAGMLLAVPAFAGQSTALVIGNSDYASRPLKNPVNDARAVAERLRALGFEVTLKENSDLRTMLGALREFTLNSRDSRTRVFYYAGHGFQLKGKNYLLPVDAEIRSEQEIVLKSADVSELLDKLQGFRTGLNIVILDACRTPPYISVGHAGTRGLGNAVSGGLAPLIPARGTLIAYSTAPNSVARDFSDGGRKGEDQHSTYTRHLIQNIGTPGLPVEQMFKRVRIAVAQETGQAQIPWESSSLTGDFCFRPGRNGACPTVEALSGAGAQ